MANLQGGDLFIVDNSDSDWKVRQYLHGWCELASRIDVATGYFEIGSLLTLDGQWQKLDELRILMGDEVSKGTKKALLAGRAAAALQRANASIEEQKKTDDFLTGADAVVEAMRVGKIRAKVYTKGKFHAKAYINHARNPVIGSAALVGSSNFTYPGLTNNIELNIQVKGREVQLLQEWYERHWNDADDITAELLQTVERHTRDYQPFDVYAKALYEFFRSGRLEPDAWEATQSKMYKVLDQYQKDGYHNLIDIAKVYNGALLCDGVGLGKTFIGLMLIERLALHENKNVLLLVPKSGRDTVWKPELSRYLPDLSRGAFSSLEVLTHTDLTATSGQITERLAAAMERAHVVIIDEAHNFRNIGTRGDFTGDLTSDGPARGGKLITGEGKVKASRYRKLFDLIGSKPVYMLTATPVNNDLSDLRHLIELFSRRRDDYFANSSVAIKNLRSYFNEMRKRLEKATHSTAQITDAEEVKAVLSTDKLVSALVVQRSRGYVKASQQIHGGRGVMFPARQDPQVAEYSLKGVYGKLLGMIADAFDKQHPLFSLPMYQPLNYRKVDTGSEDQELLFTLGRQTQIVALIRTGFLKRLESSVVAFKVSCQRLLIKLLAFIVKNAETASEKRQFETWTRSHKQLVAEMRAEHPDLLTLGKEPTLLDALDDDEEGEADLLSEAALDNAEKLDRKVYNVGDMLGESMQDLSLVAQLLDELRTFKPKQDVKLQALLKLLRTDPVLREHKVMIFSEFTDTAEYLRDQLIAEKITGVEAVDGSAASRNRTGIVKRFSPYYNRSSSAEALAAGGEIRVLVSTDVLSEGLNLQDATRLINYDLHWNPVRLMQRIGRVDRRLNPEIEAKLLADHPNQKEIRGTTTYWNFLPPDELNTLLTLYTRVTKKTLNISKTFGIEGKKLLRPDDDYDALRDFNAAYEQKTKTEELALEYERLLAATPGLAHKLETLPGRVFSGKAHITPGTKAVFFCYQLPTRITRPSGFVQPAAPLFDGLQTATEPEAGQEPGWSIAAGPVQWYIFDTAAGTVHEAGGGCGGDAPTTAKLIACAPPEPRKVSGDLPSLTAARKAVERHIKDTYFKQVQAPMGTAATLKCWMELT